MLPDASRVPGARFVMIPGSGHMTMQDNTAVNNQVVADFLKEMDKTN